MYASAIGWQDALDVDEILTYLAANRTAAGNISVI